MAESVVVQRFPALITAACAVASVATVVQYAVPAAVPVLQRTGDGLSTANGGGW